MGISDYLPPAPSQSNDDCYPQHHPHHHYAYPFYPHHYHHHHVHCQTNCDYYGGTGQKQPTSKSYAHHTYQTIGPATISSTLIQQHHYNKVPENIEIIDSKKSRSFDVISNE